MAFFRKKAGKDKKKKASAPTEEQVERGAQGESRPAWSARRRRDSEPMLRKRTGRSRTGPADRKTRSHSMATLGLQRLKAKTSKGKALGRAAGAKPFTPISRERLERMRAAREGPTELVELDRITSRPPKPDFISPPQPTVKDVEQPAASRPVEPKTTMRGPIPSHDIPPPSAAPPPPKLDTPIPQAPSDASEGTAGADKPLVDMLDDGSARPPVEEFSIQHGQTEATFTYHQRTIELKPEEVFGEQETDLVLERLDGSPAEEPASPAGAEEVVEPEVETAEVEPQQERKEDEKSAIEAVIERFDRLAEEERRASERSVEEFMERIGGLKTGTKLKPKIARPAPDEGAKEPLIIERFGEPKFREPHRVERRPAAAEPPHPPGPAEPRAEPAPPSRERVEVETGPPHTPEAERIELKTQAAEPVPTTEDARRAQQQEAEFRLLEPDRIFGSPDAGVQSPEPIRPEAEPLVDQAPQEIPPEPVEPLEAAQPMGVEPEPEAAPAVEEKIEEVKKEPELDLVGAFSEAMEKLMAESADEEAVASDQETEGLVEYKPEEVEDLGQMFLQMLSNYLKPLEEGFDTLERGEYDEESIAGLLGAVRPLISAAIQMGFDEIAERLKEIETPLQMYRRGKLTRFRQTQLVNMALSYRQLLKILPKPKRAVAEHERFLRANELLALLKTVPEVTSEHIERLFACGISTMDVVRRTPPYEISITTGIPEKIAYNIYTEVIKSMEKEV